MYTSMEEWLCQTEQKNLPMWKVMQLNDCHESNICETDSFEKMRTLYKAMIRSDADYDPALHSASGLVGGEAELLRRYREKGQSMLDGFLSAVMERALRIASSNACMHVIVATPTAGSCGVLPSVLISAQQYFSYHEDDIIQSLYIAAGVGGIIAHRASISGAAGGCQAEIGSASAMAASALVSLRSGTCRQITDAAAIALKGMLGLVCDPVCGLVEVPCVKRNVIGAINAVSSAEMALAGIQSQIPADQVFDAMGQIGRQMPASLRETARGGLAATPEAEKIARRLKQKL